VYFQKKKNVCFFCEIVIAHNRKTTLCAFAAAAATFAVACLCGGWDGYAARAKAH
jgi:phosphatidylglycerophosphate synthase